MATGFRERSDSTYLSFPESESSPEVKVCGTPGKHSGKCSEDRQVDSGDEDLDWSSLSSSSGLLFSIRNAYEQNVIQHSEENRRATRVIGRFVVTVVDEGSSSHPDPVDPVQEDGSGSRAGVEVVGEESGCFNCSPLCAAVKRAAKKYVAAPILRVSRSLRGRMRKLFRGNSAKTEDDVHAPMENEEVEEKLRELLEAMLGVLPQVVQMCKQRLQRLQEHLAEEILERSVYNQLSLFLTLNNLQDPHQSGFKAAHSTETALIAVTEKLHAAKAARLSSVLILLDLSAAFDTVDHKILLSILAGLGITGSAWQWFASYLQGRSYQVSTRISACLADVSSWMAAHHLKLNPSKTELLYIPGTAGPRNDLAITFENSLVTPSTEARSLGVVMDDQLSFSSHVANVTRSCRFLLYNIRRIRPFLSREATQVLVQSLVTSRLDYCNSLLAGLPLRTIRPLQLIQNAAARVVFNVPKFSHVTPLLRSLHWLPVAARIRFKTLTLAYKAKNGPAPPYLMAMVKSRSAPRALRASSTARLDPPSLKIRGRQASRLFSVLAPKWWNELPLDVRTAESLAVFKRRLKTHLFREYLDE
ncbi:uncharacterized protein [Salminus brasiliensis]|uniref:uncharacterized protein n=1 Tax=Salminus brasiliensis TaxID=930266 RepID=UPI003B8334AA